MSSRPLAVIAVGGNALIKDSAHQSWPDQVNASAEAMAHIVAVIEQGWDVVVTHGNGPQVGFLLRRTELAAGELHTVPLDVLGADTQGATGYMFTRLLHGQFVRRGLDRQAVSVVTQTVVDGADPAFGHPTKPVGSFMTAEQAKAHASADGWTVVEDAGRGWRRVVPSPVPKRIVEIDAIAALVAAGYTVVAAGGGGIPVTEDGADYVGVEAVIDKDLSSAVLAGQLGARLLVISTAVDAVAIGFGTPDQRWLDRLTSEEALAYLAAGEFGAGSMAPKIQAAIDFVRAGGERAIITSPERIVEAIAGTAGTTIVG